MAKIIKRIGASTSKTQFQITIHYIQIEFPAQMPIRIVWRKGKSISQTRDIQVSPLQRYTQIQQTVSMGVTLYRKKNKPLLQKKAVLIIQGCLKDKWRRFGIIELNLADHFEFPSRNLACPILKSKDKDAIISLSVVAVQQQEEAVESINESEFLEEEQKEVIDEVQALNQQYEELENQFQLMREELKEKKELIKEIKIEKTRVQEQLGQVQMFRIQEKVHHQNQIKENKKEIKKLQVVQQKYSLLKQENDRLKGEIRDLVDQLADRSQIEELNEKLKKIKEQSETQKNYYEQKLSFLQLNIEELGIKIRQTDALKQVLVRIQQEKLRNQTQKKLSQVLMETEQQKTEIYSLREKFAQIELPIPNKIQSEQSGDPLQYKLSILECHLASILAKYQT